MVIGNCSNVPDSSRRNYGGREELCQLTETSEKANAAGCHRLNGGCQCRSCIVAIGSYVGICNECFKEIISIILF